MNRPANKTPDVDSVRHGRILSLVAVSRSTNRPAAAAKATTIAMGDDQSLNPQVTGSERTPESGTQRVRRRMHILHQHGRLPRPHSAAGVRASLFGLWVLRLLPATALAPWEDARRGPELGKVSPGEALHRAGSCMAPARKKRLRFAPADAHACARFDSRRHPTGRGSVATPCPVTPNHDSKVAGRGMRQVTLKRKAGA